MRPSSKPSIELSNEGKLKISKVEAAVFQLETAVDLWFSNGDAASIVTLSFAAHEILYRLNKSNPAGTKTMLEPDDDLFISKELKKQWPTLFKMDAVFCKHAGKAPPEEVHFLAHKNLKYVIVDAIRMYNALGFARRCYFQIFQAWLWTTKPELFHIKQTDLGMKETNIREVVRAGKKVFFDAAKVAFKGKFSAPRSPVVRKIEST